MSTRLDRARTLMSRGGHQGGMRFRQMDNAMCIGKAGSEGSSDGLWMFDESSPFLQHLLDPLSTSGTDVLRISRWCGYPLCESHSYYRRNPIESTVYPYYAPHTTRCGHCNAIYYCNRECQQLHRPVHKDICSALWKYDRKTIEDCALHSIKSYWWSFGGASHEPRPIHGNGHIDNVITLASHLSYSEKQCKIHSHN